MNCVGLNLTLLPYYRLIEKNKGIRFVGGGMYASTKVFFCYDKVGIRFCAGDLFGVPHRARNEGQIATTRSAASAFQTPQVFNVNNSVQAADAARGREIGGGKGTP